jgi:hypothetical protein
LQGKVSETQSSDKASVKGAASTNGNGAGGGAPAGILESMGVAENVADDPVVLFFQKNWRFLVVLCAAFALVYFARTAYLNTFEKTMRGAADVFAVTRQEYYSLVQAVDELKKIDQEAEGGKEKLKEATEKRDEIITRLNSNLLALKNEREPYSALSALYSGLARLAVGDTAQAEQEFSKLNWQALPAESTADRMVAELAALNVARAKLDSDATVADGKKLLDNLARNGKFVNVSAAAVLGMIAATDEEKKAAADVIAQILQDNPEQSDVLQSELDRLSE